MKTTLATRPLPPGIRPRRELALTVHHLFDDLSGTHVALQPALTGGAERAGHTASGLTETHIVTRSG
jgi:hypothetical protein